MIICSQLLRVPKWKDSNTIEHEGMNWVYPPLYRINPVFNKDRILPLTYLATISLSTMYLTGHFDQSGKASDLYFGVPISNLGRFTYRSEIVMVFVNQSS
jgi:hypothetical protein